MKLSLVSGISRTGEKKIEHQDVERAIGWLLEAEKLMPDVYRAMKGESDELILDNLHYQAVQWYIKNDRKPVSTSILIKWLHTQVTSQRVFHVFNVAEGSALIQLSGEKGEYFIPLPKRELGE